MPPRSRSRLPADPGDTSRDPGPERSSLSQARRYSPRGHTVREAAEEKRARGGDPFRPALEVAAGGRTTGGSKAGGGRAGGSKAGGRTTGGGRAAGPRAGAGDKPARKPAPRRAPVRRPKKPARPPRLGDPARRLRVATVLVLVLVAVIGGRLVQLQVTDAQAYAAEGLADRLHRVVLGAPRGAILDRTGAVLAHSVEARYVYADPSMIDNAGAAAVQLSPLLGLAPSELIGKLVKHNRADGRPSQFEWLARGVNIATGDAVRALNIKGIGVMRDERREVPGHDLAANLLGFVGDDLHGLAGLEARYDDLLYGVNGEKEFETGRGDLDKEIPGGYLRETPAQPGSSLGLTIDRDLQFRVQQILSQQMRRVNAMLGAAVVLDVHNGEVLAQASYPPYDAADPFKVRPAQRGDVATGVVVDPGSVAKVITIGGALQEGVITPDSTVVIGPRIRKGDREFTDTHPLPEGTPQTLPGILAFSSNVGTIRISEKLGAQRLYEYQRRFGLGEATGVGLPGESEGLVQPPENWSGSSYGSIPIGHGIAVTPLQMAAIYAAIANDGLWVQPHLVRETIRPDGTHVPAPAADSRRVMSLENASALRRILEAVVTVPEATGLSAAVPSYRVAGKTGTGSKVENGHYVGGQVASFVGIAPAEAPRYVIAVFAHTPGGEGGAVAGPAFREMMEFTLRHYHVPPSVTPEPMFTVAR
ncbi:MAG TPA: penicillin-binding protein 2 [Micromonosporaceae bacterium]|nr:penicillin-binding protein 2 [Micromonosporaceae bacterium]